MNFKILTDNLCTEFQNSIKKLPDDFLDKIQENEIIVNPFDFYKSVSTVYSAKIEGENIDFDSYFKHKFLNVKFKTDYTKRSDDLYDAYSFMEFNPLDKENLWHAHEILSRHVLPKSQRGITRNNPMFVINEEDKIEYIAAQPIILETALANFFHDLELLQNADLDCYQVFYYASLLHLVFVKIHPFQDGNGRAARLLEKWFLKEKLTVKALAIPLEKNYYTQREVYYKNIRNLGLDYNELDYSKALEFLKMTISAVHRKLED